MLRNPLSPAKANRHFRPGRILHVKANVEMHTGLEQWEIYHGSPCAAKGWLQIFPSLRPTSLSRHRFRPLLKAPRPGRARICVHALKITKTTNPRWSKAQEVQAQSCFAFPPGERPAKDIAGRFITRSHLRRHGVGEGRGAIVQAWRRSSFGFTPLLWRLPPMTPVLPERIHPKEKTPHQPNRPQSNSPHHHREGARGGSAKQET